ncbi:hypothetical protein IWZ01DRAFT_555329, partial [Phyllosticta capitalensis]
MHGTVERWCRGLLAPFCICMFVVLVLSKAFCLAFLLLLVTGLWHNVSTNKTSTVHHHIHDNPTVRHQINTFHLFCLPPLARVNHPIHKDSQYQPCPHQRPHQRSRRTTPTPPRPHSVAARAPGCAAYSRTSRAPPHPPPPPTPLTAAAPRPPQRSPALPPPSRPRPSSRFPRAEETAWTRARASRGACTRSWATGTGDWSRARRVRRAWSGGVRALLVVVVVDQAVARRWAGIGCRGRRC